jgi:hypothetical protein
MALPGAFSNGLLEQVGHFAVERPATHVSMRRLRPDGKSKMVNGSTAGAVDCFFRTLCCDCRTRQHQTHFSYPDGSDRAAPGSQDRGAEQIAPPSRREQIFWHVKSRIWPLPTIPENNSGYIFRIVFHHDVICPCGSVSHKPSASTRDISERVTASTPAGSPWKKHSS